ncbi:MAG TPA: pyridoxal-phosphate dependent enzyme [Cellulomonas sp.]
MSDRGLRVYDSILDLLPSVEDPTPMVRLRHVPGFRHAVVYAKLEWYNPFGAVKDRVAANLVRDAEERGEHLQTLVEPTSGNTGIGLAMIANAKHYGFAATLSNQIPAEKRSALRLFGTDLYELDDDLCPMPGQPEGAMAKAAELAAQPGWTELNQYQNPANPDAHYRTTGPEIWRQTGGRVTHFVASLGTCGTITGTGRFLKEQNPDVKVIGVHPTVGHDIPGVRSLPALALTDFFRPEEYDGVVEIKDDEAYGLCRRLFVEESVIAGPSSGLALAGALRTVPDEPGVVAVVVFPDNAFKYTSSFRRHLPDLFPPEAEAPQPAPAPFQQHLDAAFGFAKDGPDVVDVLEAKRLLDAGVAVVDVRNPDEVARVRIGQASNVPLPELSAGRTAGLPTDLRAPVVTICAAGTRSLYALLILKAQGYTDVKSVDGGMGAWVRAGLPVVASA